MTQADIAANVAAVRERMAQACERAGRRPDEVTLVAVSKRKSAGDILAAIDAGVRHFGENRVEEARDKIPAVMRQTAQPITWHMIGHIQSRKAKAIAPLFDVVQAVDSLKLARKLSRMAEEDDSALPVLLEMNVSGEASKEGFAAADWQMRADARRDLWEAVRTISALPGLQVRGLMTMAPFVDDMEATRPTFLRLAQLRAALADDLGLALPDLSMGMTNDYPVAIEEGATMIRIGRAIFGERDHA